MGKALGMAAVKNRQTASTSWNIWHTALAGNEYILFDTGAKATDGTRWNSTIPSSTVFSLGTSAGPNENTKNYVAYCYADSAIQKSFSYSGNGVADGPNPFLGMKCGRTLVKNASASEGWEIIDSTRDQTNVTKALLELNTTSAENIASDQLDLTAMSVKVRNTRTAYNTSASTYIGHAWAATTGKFANSS